MRIKKYTASSMKEALLKIKQDLGDDAMILKTSKFQSVPTTKNLRCPTKKTTPKNFAA